MNLDITEKDQLLNGMSKDPYFKKSQSKTFSYKFGEVSIGVMLVGLAVTLIVNAITPAPKDGMSFPATVISRITLAYSALSSLIIVFFGDKIEQIGTKAALPIVCFSDTIEKALYKMQNEDFEYQYQLVRQYINHIYAYLFDCAEQETYLKAKKLIESDTDLLLLQKTINDKNLIQTATPDQLQSLTNEYINKLAKLDDKLLNLLTPEIEKNALQLINNNHLEYVLQRIKQDVTNKRIENVLNEVKHESN